MIAAGAWGLFESRLDSPRFSRTEPGSMKFNKKMFYWCVVDNVILYCLNCCRLAWNSLIFFYFLPVFYVPVWPPAWIGFYNVCHFNLFFCLNFTTCAARRFFHRSPAEQRTTVLLVTEIIINCFSNHLLFGNTQQLCRNGKIFNFQKLESSAAKTNQNIAVERS